MNDPVILFNLFQNLQGVQEDFEERKSKALRNGTTLQGFIVRVRGKLAAQHYYVVCESIRYKCSTVVSALETLMQLHLSYNIHYNFASSMFYTLIQRSVYNIKTPHDKVSPKVAILLRQLELKGM